MQVQAAKKKLARTAECWAPLTTTASNQQEVQKETTPHADLLLDAWLTLQMHGNVCDAWFFLIFFWIEFVPVICTYNFAWNLLLFA